MRTQSSIKNLIYAFGGQLAGILISLLARFAFVKILSAEYLGLNGLFTNILSMLSLVELGVGPAIIFSLYKPLADGNKEKVKSLMALYKKAYILIGILILVIGVSITPFLPNIIEEMPSNIENINLIYILFVVNTAVSYFFSYKRSLLISDQKRYLATLYRYICYFVLNVLQIIVLLITKDYILFLIIQITMTLVENILVSRKTDKLYPYIKEKDIKKLEKEDTEPIRKNIIAMFAHKIGGIVVSSTDNLIISKYVGLVAVGIYSNYYLIINAINLVATQVFTSITASLGNLCATAKKEKQYDVFEKIFFINFWIYGFTSICLFVLFNDFIQLWVGTEYLFGMEVVAIIIINYYITGMRKTVLTFRDAMGLYWQDRFKPIAESIINIIVSIALVQRYGVLGVFVGTFVSTMTTCFWVEPYVLFKHGLKTKLRKYFVKYGVYTIATIGVGIITVLITNLIGHEVNIINFIIKLLICLIIPNIIFVLLFFKTKEYKYFKDLIKLYATKIFNKIKRK